MRSLAFRGLRALNTYNQWERGIGRPRLDEAIRLVDEYDLTLDWIYLGDHRRLPYELVDAIRRGPYHGGAQQAADQMSEGVARLAPVGKP